MTLASQRPVRKPMTIRVRRWEPAGPGGAHARAREGTERGVGPPRVTEPGSGAEPRRESGSGAGSRPGPAARTRAPARERSGAWGPRE